MAEPPHPTQPPQPTRITLALPTVDLVALTWGDPGAPLALLLHGFPDTAHTWRHLGPALAAAGYYAVAPYTRGYAPSSLARDDRYDVDALAADAVAARDAVAGGTDAVIIGHDWGGITAQAVAADPSRPFRRAVVLAIPSMAALTAETEHNPTRSLLPLLDQVRRSWYIGFNQLPRLPERFTPALVRRLWRAWSPGYDAEVEGDLAEVWSAMPDQAHRRAVYRYYRALPGTRGDAAWLQAPHVPTQYLHGRRDGCLSPVLAERSGSVMVDGAGHFLHLERPIAVRDAVLDFLAAEPGQAS